MDIHGSLATRLEAIALRLEAIASRLEAVPIRGHSWIISLRYDPHGNRLPEQFL